MKLSSFKRIIDKDFPAESQKLVAQLALSINSSFDLLYNALNKNITFSENINSTTATFDVTVDINGFPTKPASPSFTLETNQSQAIGLIVINAYGTKDTGLYPTGGIFVSFVKSEKSIVIKNIKGLEANKPYTLTVVVVN